MWDVAPMSDRMVARDKGTPQDSPKTQAIHTGG